MPLQQCKGADKSLRLGKGWVLTIVHNTQSYKLRETEAQDAVKRPKRQSFLKSNQTSLSKHDSSLCLTGKPDLLSMSGWKFVVWNLILCNLCQSNLFDKWHLRQRAYFFVLHKTILSGRKWFPMSRMRKQPRFTDKSLSDVCQNVL